MTSLGRPRFRDVIAGLVTGLFSIPEGMAYASIGGFNPVAGLYSGVVSTIVGSLFARTVLMVTTLTSALALSSRSVITEAGLDPADPANIAALAIVVGVVMLVFGLLKFGSIMNFVSNAVMTGFTTGIALQILAGVIKDATGYKPRQPQHHRQVHRRFRPSRLVGVGAVSGRAGHRGGVGGVPLHQAARGVRDAHRAGGGDCRRDGHAPGLETVGDIALIPNALPPFVVPHFAAIPELLVGGLAVALVGLAQAAGISAAVANPDGSRPNTSGDFVAQGAANLAGGFFGALPTGGSLSRTGVAVSAGAQTRWAGIFAGVWLAALVLIAGSLAELIPMPVIGGLILVIGAELVAGRWADIKLVLRAAPLSAVAMIVTFLATTQLPLHTAILIGAITSLVLYCVKASQVGRTRRAEAPGRRRRLVVAGARDRREQRGHGAAVHRSGTVRRGSAHRRGMAPGRRIAQCRRRARRADAARRAVVQGHQVDAQVGRGPSGQRRQIDHGGCQPVRRPRSCNAGGLTEQLGPNGVVPASDRLFGATEEAVNRGQQWIAGKRDTPSTG